MSKCKNCGHNNPGDYKFFVCSKCGKSNEGDIETIWLENTKDALKHMGEKQ